MERRSTFLAACSLIVVACANAEDDSWNGAAGDKIHETAGGNGGQAPLGGAASDGGNPSDGGSPSVSGPGPTTVTSGPTTTTSGGGSCDMGSCDSCQTCAMNGPCAASIDACFGDIECNALLECLGACVDDLCFQGCVDAHPGGMPLYNAVGDCIYCDACLTTCGGC
jgi:hypothetical protein